MQLLEHGRHQIAGVMSGCFLRCLPVISPFDLNPLHTLADFLKQIKGARALSDNDDRVSFLC